MGLWLFCFVVCRRVEGYRLGDVELHMIYRCLDGVLVVEPALRDVLRGEPRDVLRGEQHDGLDLQRIGQLDIQISLGYLSRFRMPDRVGVWRWISSPQQ